MDNGSFNYDNATTSYDINYVLGSQYSAKSYLRTVKLWTDEAITISLVATRGYLSTNATVTVIIKDINNNPLNGITVSLSAAVDTATATTNESGIATTGIEISKSNNTITATVVHEEKHIRRKLKQDAVVLCALLKVH